MQPNTQPFQLVAANFLHKEILHLPYHHCPICCNAKQTILGASHVEFPSGQSKECNPLPPVRPAPCMGACCHLCASSNVLWDLGPGRQLQTDTHTRQWVFHVSAGERTTQFKRSSSSKQDCAVPLTNEQWLNSPNRLHVLTLQCTVRVWERERDYMLVRNSLHWSPCWNEPHKITIFDHVPPNI